MAAGITISLDAMGGDNGPDVVIDGLALTHKVNPEVRFLLFGDQAALEQGLRRHAKLAAVCDIVHVEDAVPMDMKPTQALRKREGTSMWAAIEAVKEGKAKAVVSAGNTGALMAMSRMGLGMLNGIDRPAIAAMWPTQTGRSIVLDVGANVEATSGHLLDFAIMGRACAKVLFHKENPSVGLLNIGSEDLKGHSSIREAAELLRDTELGLNFVGFVEGDDISAGTVDVVVTDGFTGNVALKSAEGTARLVAGFMREAFTQSWLTKLGAAIAGNAFSTLRTRLDPSNANGGPFMGLNGLVVKSHGGTDAQGFASAISVAIELTQGDFVGRIAQSIERVHATLEKESASDASQNADSSEEGGTPRYLNTQRGEPKKAAAS